MDGSTPPRLPAHSSSAEPAEQPKWAPTPLLKNSALPGDVFTVSGTACDAQQIAESAIGWLACSGYWASYANDLRWGHSGSLDHEDISVAKSWAKDFIALTQQGPQQELSIGSLSFVKFPLLSFASSQALKKIPSRSTRETTSGVAESY
jgi:hypothetical protein